MKIKFNRVWFTAVLSFFLTYVITSSCDNDVTAPTFFVDAGPDQIVTTDSDSALVTLEGTSDAQWPSYAWTEERIEIATGQPQVIKIADRPRSSVKLALGAHLITLTVKAEDGDKKSDQVIVTVISQGPGTFTNPRPLDFIDNVEISGIVADTSIYGTVVSANNPPLPPWQTRFKFALDSDSLNTLSQNRNNLSYVGTEIDFSGSTLTKLITGFNFMLMPNDTLLTDFSIPKTIPNFDITTDTVFIIIKITDFGTQSLLLKERFPLVSFAEEGETVQAMKPINQELQEVFDVDVVGDDSIISGPIPPTPIL